MKELLTNLTRTEGKYFQSFVCNSKIIYDDFHPAPNVAVVTCTVYLLSSSATSCSCSCETGVAGMPKPGGDLTRAKHNNVVWLSQLLTVDGQQLEWMV